jgi:hypothetical protein
MDNFKQEILCLDGWSQDIRQNTELFSYYVLR